MTIYYEDLEPGTAYEYGSKTMEKAEMLEFAERYDPQPIHVDEGAAREAGHGGLVASGLHTFCVASRLTYDNFFRDLANEIGIGVDEVRWHVPVLPGDELHVRTEVTERRPSESRPEAGVVVRDTEVMNQDDDVVMSWTAINLISNRPS